MNNRKELYESTVPNPAPPPAPPPPVPQTGRAPGGGPVPSIPCGGGNETAAETYVRTTPERVRQANDRALERAVKHHGGGPR